ncbi:unnamed protein product [Acanthoscelides obtectus]|uniref:Uncharacterized protein n=1 Tax=Acanthoscelides obtectus TaxID=200917 RepID=A0A9P0KJS1_ACAOB|nr:unnamed protein product [Acanthoscelides obtectus]CAK1627690.1 hypothetical protein AOBTE_LOCUS4768 [Acanthoscelides obtectus]
MHRQCVPKGHHKHMPQLGDDDLFICHDCYKEESEDEEERSSECSGLNDRESRNSDGGEQAIRMVPDRKI